MTSRKDGSQSEETDEGPRIIDAEFEVIQGPEEAEPLPAKTTPQWREDLMGLLALVFVVGLIFVVGKVLQHLGALWLHVFYR